MTEDEKNQAGAEAADNAENEDAPPDSEAPPEAAEETSAEQGVPPADAAGPKEEGEETEAGPKEMTGEAGGELTPEQQVEELNDKMLRALAEAENVRRRAERDKSDAAKYAIANFAREVLGVADNMKRAMASFDADARKEDPAL